jgi:ankyrin repeat protein
VTALMYAAAGGHEQICDILLAHGADANARHKQGGTALLEAATNGSTRVIEALLKAGADPFVVDDDGVTALMSAASQGHLDASRVLVGKGLDVNAVATSGGTAVMFAAGGGHNETVRYLLEQGADVNVVVKATPLYKEQVATALAEGADDVEPHVDGVTALMVAAQGGHLEVCTMLTEAGADVGWRTRTVCLPCCTR